MVFFRRIQFNKVDPLANGLAEEIAAEQYEADSIQSLDDPSAEELQEKWSRIVKDAHEDPDWFSFTDS